MKTKSGIKEFLGKLKYLGKYNKYQVYRNGENFLELHQETRGTCLRIVTRFETIDQLLKWFDEKKAEKKAETPNPKQLIIE